MKVIARDVDVKDRLADLRLTKEELREAVTTGERERVSCSRFHPLSYPGTTAWAMAVEMLRRLKCTPRQGWRFSNKNNLSLTIEPELAIAIAVVAGSETTADPERPPTTKHPKGSMIQGQVERNQFLLFGPGPSLAPLPADQELVTWFLLVYSAFHPQNDKTGTHVASCELSLPAAIDEHGWVTRWAERIILGEIRVDDVPEPQLPETSEEAEVSVTRRSV